MAADAARYVSRIITGESTSSVMTGEAVVAGCSAMLEDRNVRHLTCVWSPRNNIVTFVTAHTLTERMIAVPEDRLKIIFRLRSAIVRGQLVANGARTDLALGGMTTIAIIVGSDADRDRLAGARGIVAVSASVRWPPFSGFVRGVVKLHIKALDKLNRKCVHRWRVRLGIFMTDRADDLILVGKLVQVTADARVVTGIVHFERTALTPVARVAGKLLMLGDLVRKRFECFIRFARGHQLGRLGRGKDRRGSLLLFKTACRKGRYRDS